MINLNIQIMAATDEHVLVPRKQIEQRWVGGLAMKNRYGWARYINTFYYLTVHTHGKVYGLKIDALLT